MSGPASSYVHIRYRRPPGRLEVHVQRLVHDDGRVKITFARGLDFDPPLVIGGRVALERGSDAVWFTYPGAWHDIGRFHRADGTFTGVYANVITPCVFEPGGDWDTTDLFLDLWIPADGDQVHVLDQDELARAEREGSIGRELAARARVEASRLLEEARRGTWPPPEVGRWTRDRVLAHLGG